MTRKLVEIIAAFRWEKIRFDKDVQEDEESTALLECDLQQDGLFDQNVIVKVMCMPDDFAVGLNYRFYGSWHTHEKYGKQFHAKTFVIAQPHGEAGIVRYLIRAPHIGQVAARKLYQQFQGDAVRIAREQPDVAAVAVGGSFNLERAQIASSYFEQEKATEETTIDMIELLGGRGFPKDLGRRLVAEWGNRAPELIRRNPYLLMKFRSCGFLRTHQMYLDLGGDPARLKCQTLCGWYAAARDTTGHTWHTSRTIEAGMREMIAGTHVRPLDAVLLGIRSGLLSKWRDRNGKLWLAEGGKARKEEIVAARVRQWISDDAEWPDDYKLNVSDHQGEKLLEALESPISILSGGPGTGKTYSAARMIAAAIQSGRGQACACAPTGKAAVRLTELLDGYEIPLKAKTIHSTLRVASHSEGAGWAFEHHDENPLPYKWVFVDEASMLDTNLASSLFQACPTGSHIMLIGDTGQLPPVGHGAPLRDLTAAGVPHGTLTEIRRNSGRIVRACHQILVGEQFSISQSFNPDRGENLALLASSDPSRSHKKIVETISKIGSRGIADPVWGVQVICAVNAKSQLSREVLNKQLQSELNPTGRKVPGNPFRQGDKIVCLKNGLYPVVPEAPSGYNTDRVDGKVSVANGEQGLVKVVELRRTIVQLSAPDRLIIVPRGTESQGDGDNSDKSGDSGCQWDLAYAISCHKSQGSEWPVVIVVLDEYPGSKMVCSREWLYTAVSRAKGACFLVGRLSTAYDMIDRQAIYHRKTFLKELISND